MEIINTDGVAVQNGFCFNAPTEPWPEDPLVTFVLFEARLRAKAAGWKASVRTHKTANDVKRFRAVSPDGEITLALDISVWPNEMARWSEFDHTSQDIAGLGELSTLDWPTPEQVAVDKAAIRKAWDDKRDEDNIAAAERFVEKVGVVPVTIDVIEARRLRKVALDFLNRV